VAGGLHCRTGRGPRTLQLPDCGQGRWPGGISSGRLAGGHLPGRSGPAAWRAGRAGRAEGRSLRSSDRLRRDLQPPSLDLSGGPQR
jgi:hypothetical protein